MTLSLCVFLALVLSLVLIVFLSVFVLYFSTTMQFKRRLISSTFETSPTFCWEDLWLWLMAFTFLPYELQVSILSGRYVPQFVGFKCHCHITAHWLGNRENIRRGWDGLIGVCVNDRWASGLLPTSTGSVHPEGLSTPCWHTQSSSVLEVSGSRKITHPGLLIHSSFDAVCSMHVEALT